MSDAAAPYFRQDKDPFKKRYWGRIGSVYIVRSERSFNEAYWFVRFVVSDELREPVWLSHEDCHFSKVFIGAVVRPEDKTKLQPARAFDGVARFDHDA